MKGDMGYEGLQEIMKGLKCFLTSGFSRGLCPLS
jgi:hypothetical protein